MHVLSHALHYGTEVFERARCYDTTRGPAIFRWEEHLDRLYDSAKFYEMEIPFSREELTEATLELRVHAVDRNPDRDAVERSD